MFFEYIFPIIVLGGFIVYVGIHLFQKKPKISRSPMYCADSTNTAPDAREVMETIVNGAIKPNYLGSRDNGRN